MKPKNWMDTLFSGLVFKILYVILTLVSFNAFLYYLPFMNWLILFVTGFGILNGIYRIWHLRDYIKTPYLWLGIAFLASYLITVVANLQYGYLDNLKGFVWLLFQIGLLFANDIGKQRESIQREFQIVGIVFVAYVTIAAIISVGMVFVNFGEMYILKDTTPVTAISRGFVWGRLWGVFTDPNYGSATVCLSFIISLYFLTKARKWTGRVLSVIAVTAAFLYIVFSDSRTGQITLAASLFVWFYIYLVNRHNTRNSLIQKHSIKHYMWITISSLALSALVLTGTVATKYVYNNYLVSQEGGGTVIEREYDDEVDISNRRFDLWKSGIELFETDPVTGVGFRNFQEAAKDRIPDTYLVNNSSAVEFDAYHNMWVDILVAQGILGASIFGLFTIFNMIASFKVISDCLKNCRSEAVFSGTLLAGIVVSVVSSLFISDTVYVNTPNAVMFWILLGYIANLYANLKSESRVMLKSKGR